MPTILIFTISFATQEFTCLNYIQLNPKDLFHSCGKLQKWEESFFFKESKPKISQHRRLHEHSVISGWWQLPKAGLSPPLWTEVQALVWVPSRSHTFPRAKRLAGCREIPHISVSTSVWPKETHPFVLLHCCPRPGDRCGQHIQVRTGVQLRGLSISTWPLCASTVSAGADMGLLPFPHQQIYVSSSSLLTERKMSERKSSQPVWDLGVPNKAPCPPDTMVTPCFPGHIRRRRAAWLPYPNALFGHVPALRYDSEVHHSLPFPLPVFFPCSPFSHKESSRHLGGTREREQRAQGSAFEMREVKNIVLFCSWGK